MSNTFFTADPHYGHDNIIRHSKRPFLDYNEMDEALIENWNKVVTRNSDEVYILGDFTFYSKILITDPASVFARLRGQKFLIVGNHDRAPTFKLKWGWVKDTYFLKHLNQEGIWLSHYPHRSWRNSFHGSWHLFGHNHGNVGPYGRSFDVGVDCWDYTPIAFETVQTKMKTLNPISQ
jgi:calcineurin-like phosphoesterase family protein